MSKPFKELMAEQDRFDALVSLRRERSGETLEGAIAWASEFIARTEAKTPESPRLVIGKPYPLYRKKSPIHGVGAFTKRGLKAGEVVAQSRLKGWRGFNHSCDPNVRLVLGDGAETSYLILRDIPRWAELTVSYGKASKNTCNCPICGRGA